MERSLSKFAAGDCLKEDFFETSDDFFGNSDQFNEFLKQTFTFLSSSVVQINTTLWTENIERWTLPGIKITRDNFKTFYNRMKFYFDDDLKADLKDFTLTTLQQEKLDHILDITLRKPISIKCENSVILVTGHSISIKNLKRLYGNHLDCDEEKLKKTKIIKIFASNTVFFDEDISRYLFEKRKKMLSLVIIAPKWYIKDEKHVYTVPPSEPTQSRKIDLIGRDGDHYNEVRDEVMKKIRKGQVEEDGYPGLPGKPGGVFFGVVDEIINHEGNLSINISGGNGGTGLDGSQGKEGASGREVRKEICGTAFCDKKNLNNGVSCSVSCFPFGTKCTAHRREDRGSVGGKGGDGGVGGIGGLPGEITLISLKESSNSSIFGVEIHKEKGADGQGGLGGPGGIGGHHVYEFNGECDFKTFNAEGPRGSRWIEFGRTANTEISWRKLQLRAGSGERGKDGYNKLNQLEPQKPVLNFEKGVVVNEYKAFLRENLKNSVNKTFDLEVHQKLETSQAIHNLYRASDFVDDFKKLENQFHALNRDVDFIKLIQYLIKRITIYAQKPQDSENSPQYKEFLRHLYLAALSRKTSIEEDLEPSLIINMIDYLKNVKEDFITTKDQKLRKTTLIESINHSNEIYKNDIIQESFEAKNQIDNQISDELENINKEIKNTMKDLLKEIQDTETDLNENSYNQTEKMKELKKILITKSISTVVRTVSTAASFFGPVGISFGLVVQIPVSIAEGVITQQATPVKNLDKTVLLNTELLKKELDTKLEKRTENMKKFLGIALEEANKYPQFYSEKIDFIKAKSEELENLSTKEKTVKRIGKMEKELKTELQMTEKNFPKVYHPDKIHGTAKNLVRLGRVMTVGSQASDLYFDYIDYENKMAGLTETIKKNEKAFEKLREIEDSIDVIIIPKLQDLIKNVDSIKSNVGNQTVVDLDLFRFEVEGIFKTTKVFMKETLGVFKIYDKIINCIEKVEAIMPVLINTNNRIIELREKMNLADYMANMNSAAAAGNPIVPDQKLDISLEELDIKTYSNFILQKYNAGIKAFKQYVFPFAKDYLKDLEVPEYLEPEKNLENLAKVAGEHITKILSKLKNYQSEIKKPLDKLSEGEFNSRKHATVPFYTWKNEDNLFDISELLSGKEVILNAVAKDILPCFGALKFNVINMDFRISDKTNKKDQEELDELMKYFKITLTHLGDSRYTFNDKSYLIKSSSVQIWFTFENNSEGIPTHASYTYKALKNGDYVLSPYATWKVKLETAPGVSNSYFNKLEYYKNITDLELGGHGIYVKKTNLDEDYWYRSIQTCEIPLNTRKKRAIDWKKREKRYLKALNNFVPRERESRSESGKSTWPSIPNFCLLPRAAASELEYSGLIKKVLNKDLLFSTSSMNGVADLRSSINDNLLNDDQFKELNSDSGFFFSYEALTSATFYFYNKIKTLNAIVPTKFTQYLSFFSGRQDDDVNSPSESSNDSYTDHLTHQTVIHQLSNFVEIGYESHGNDRSFSRNEININFNSNYNLALAHFILSKKFGANKFIENCSYMSPEQEQQMNVNNLASKVLPCLEDSHLTAEDFLYNYNNSSDWYKKMFANEFEETKFKNVQENLQG